MVHMLDILSLVLGLLSGHRPGLLPESVALAPSDRVSTRRRHPAELPFIHPDDYGKLSFKCRGGRGIETERGGALLIKDLYTHTIVLGESGSGKTYYVLNQLFEEFFRSTHLPDGEEREARKFGGLVIEAKGDFTSKTNALAQKYGRVEDIILFGPDHLNQSYDLFGDRSESPQQLADKMMQLLSAFNGGAKSNDPFWDNATRKLFTHLFLLHRSLKERGVKDLPPMSFGLLNLLIMDRGQPHNQMEIQADRSAWEKSYGRFVEELETIRSLALHFIVEVGSLNIRQMDHVTVHLEQLRSHVQGLLNSQNDQQRGEHYQAFLEEANFLTEFIRPQLTDLSRSMENPEGSINPCMNFPKNLLIIVDHLTQTIDLGELILSWSAPEPEVGILRLLLNQYSVLLQKEGRTLQQDSIYSYFNEEYLSVVNDKTSGSVGMVASNLVTLFVHPPFNRIFSAQPTFSMSDVIDQGKVVVLDMPIALYGATATLAALVLKMDFFRTMLSRHRLTILDSAKGGASPSLRQINQERPMTYFCDEFASVASTGETTGEAGFLDKVREYKCCCILGLQSIPMLLKRFSEAEVDAILTNCGNKIFLRNSDPRTTEIASKALGTEYKVNLNRGHTAMEMALNADMPIGKLGYTSSYTLGNRVEPGSFARLKDGVAYLKLNPRFGKNQMLQAAFVGCPISSPEDGKVSDLSTYPEPTQLEVIQS